MNKMKLFSIIIPVYNCENYIKKCLNSIIEQQFKDYEVIIIDDGSTDNSGNICDDFSKNNKQIRVFHNKNKGVSYSRNFALKKVNGEYVLFIDSDDYVDDDYLLKINEILKKEKCDLINMGFYSEVQNNYKTYYDKISIPYLRLNKNDLKKKIVYLWDSHMLYNVWNKIYRYEIIKKNNILFPNYNFGEDMYFNKKYMECITNFCNIEECFYHYVRERKGSITRIYNKELFNIRKNEYYEFNKYFASLELDLEEYLEFSSRRFIERTVGCIENIFSSKLKLKDKTEEIRNIINDKTVCETINNAVPKSKKMKIILLPIKKKSLIMTYLMFYGINLIRKLFPNVFNRLKNKR